MVRAEEKAASFSKSFLLLSLGLFLSIFILVSEAPYGFAVTKEEALKKYERLIVKSNQMNIYGYDLHDVTFKLKRLTEALVANQFEQAGEMLNDIQNDLEAIEAKGPEHLRRERELVWLEIFGDFIQQVAIFIVLAMLLLRLRFLMSAISGPRLGFSSIWKLTLTFTAASIFGASIGLIRYGQSSWAFVDLQILFIGLSGLIGGIWVGLATGLMNSAVRLFIVPAVNPYLAVPIVAGAAAGFFRSFLRGNRALNRLDVTWGGLCVGFLHSLFMYAPIRSYLPLRSLLNAVFFLSVAECSIIYLFFTLAWQIFKEEKKKETERELSRTRLQFLQAQINPHFLFNALNTIAAVCGEEGAERTRKLIVQLSTFFRRITKAEGDFVSIEDELEYIDAYLDMEQARFGERLEVKREICLSPAGYRSMVPILVLQPIVENAVKHGLSKKTRGGKIVIRAKELDSKIQVQVEDNGVGMDAEFLQNILTDGAKKPRETGLEHAGIGLSNIRERMTKLFGDRYEMSVTSAPDQGTTVSLTFPKSR